MRQHDPVQYANLRYMILADEPGTPNGLGHMTTRPHCQAAFRKWLMARNCKPQSLGVTNWDRSETHEPGPQGERRKATVGVVVVGFRPRVDAASLQARNGSATKSLWVAGGHCRINFEDGCIMGTRHDVQRQWAELV